MHFLQKCSSVQDPSKKSPARKLSYILKAPIGNQ